MSKDNEKEKDLSLITGPHDFPYIHRDISWLSFNERVLQEAADPNVPLMERINFLAIYSSNLDEFFRVRIAGIRNLVRVGKKTKRALEFDPKTVLKTLLKIVNKQQEEFSEIYEKNIIPALKKEDIHQIRRHQLNAEQREFVEQYFQDHLLPFVQPVLLVKKRIRPFLINGALYLAIQLCEKKKGEKHDRSKEKRVAIVKIPSDHLPRFIKLPSTKRKDVFIMLDDIVRQSISWIFPGYDIIDSYSIKLTRDADLYIEDEFTGNLITKIRKNLNKRNVGPASRLVFDREMPKDMLDYLTSTLELENFDLLPEGRYHNNSDFFKFPKFEAAHLYNIPLPTLTYKPLEKPDDFFTAMKKGDHLVQFPYHSYKSVVRFFDEAADDPAVTHIKITQYRVAKKSKIMEALIRAVKAGKQVFVFIEAKARFDEEANLNWGDRLEKEGVKVSYSFPAVKVHCKIALIVRKEGKKNQLYSYLSTGNFHEDTAKVYSDYGLFTTDIRLTKEVSRLFTFLETVKMPSENFEHLLVGQFNLRKRLIELIQQEIKNAKAGKEAKIILKMNSLQDQKMIRLLYTASNAGVTVQLIIRGICSLVTDRKNFSENIEAIGIVDRFLEHARVFVFHNNGKELMYLSSADWMVRNLNHRIETAFPIYDEALKNEISEALELQWNDNVKARLLDGQLKNEYIKGESDIALRSQHEVYFNLKRRSKA